MKPFLVIWFLKTLCPTYFDSGSLITPNLTVRMHTYIDAKLCYLISRDTVRGGGKKCTHYKVMSWEAATCVYHW